MVMVATVVSFSLAAWLLSVGVLHRDISGAERLRLATKWAVCFL